MLLASDTTVQVTLITTVGLIVVAVIGVWQVKVTSSHKRDAETSAGVAADYAAALGAKDALLTAYEARLKFLEEQNRNLIERVDDLERRDEEHYEQQRASAILEREYAREIAELKAAIEELKVR